MKITLTYKTHFDRPDAILTVDTGMHRVTVERRGDTEIAEQLTATAKSVMQDVFGEIDKHLNSSSVPNPSGIGAPIKRS